ncbi:hypothetical protein MTsPCn7_12800 [Altererythrobacter sp. MTPC7]
MQISKPKHASAFRRRALTAFAGLAMLSACSEPSVADRIARAESNLQSGDLKAARLDLISVVNEQPDNRDARLKLAQTYLALEDGEGAWSQLDALGDTRADLAVLRAEAELYRGRPAKALELAATTDDADAHRIRARAHVALGDFDAARSELEKGVEASPGDAAILSDYALFALADGDTPKASELTRRAAKAAPDAIGTRLAMGRLALAKESPDRALSHFDAILEQRADHAAAVIGKADALGELGQLDALEDFLDANEATLGSDLRFAVLQARLAATRGEWEEVRSLLQSREKELRDQPEGAYIYATALTQLGNRELARTYLTRLETRYPGDPRVAQLRSRIQSSD